ncbi:DUF3618 domain-containing protein [Nonomuraea terrae]|uniref:DUF3618 domain-containing protein n=1 Tax=Nonomuraea terrae TaxID=2530383 RepID=UPI0037B942F2
MSETDPGYSDQHAGNVGAHRATVGTPTERESINVPPTRAGAAENARRAEAAREEHETFVPEAPVQDERTEAVENLRPEEESLRGTRTGGRTRDNQAGNRTGTRRESRKSRRRGERGEDDDEGGDVRRDIEETRRELGETVSALAAKTDVKARAGHAAEVARSRAAGAAETVKGKASQVAGKVRGTAPEQVKGVTGKARKRPMLLVMAAGAVTALVVRRMMQGRQTGPRVTFRPMTRPMTRPMMRPTSRRSPMPAWRFPSKRRTAAWRSKTGKGPMAALGHKTGKGPMGAFGSKNGPMAAMGRRPMVTWQRTMTTRPKIVLHPTMADRLMAAWRSSRGQRPMVTWQPTMARRPKIVWRPTMRDRLMRTMTSRRPTMGKARMSAGQRLVMRGH